MHFAFTNDNKTSSELCLPIFPKITLNDLWNAILLLCNLLVMINLMYSLLLYYSLYQTETQGISEPQSWLGRIRNCS
jgi:hypothetical protein